MSTAQVFIARGLTKTYRMGEAQVHALRGVDLDIGAGELIVLLGPSGSGKSTLLNILGGLDTPSSGSISFQDQKLSNASEAQLTRYRREHVGFVFQFYNLIPSLTARENVALVTDIAREPMPAAEALTWVGLGQRLDHFPSQLSGDEPAAFTKISALGVEEQRVNVIIDFAEPLDKVRTIGDGFRVEAHIVTFRVDSAVKVPVGALFRDLEAGTGAWAVFVTDGGQARKRAVKASRRNATEALVESGLGPGDEVVVYPSDALRTAPGSAPCRSSPGKARAGLCPRARRSA